MHDVTIEIDKMNLPLRFQPFHNESVKLDVTLDFESRLCNIAIPMHIYAFESVYGCRNTVDGFNVVTLFLLKSNFRFPGLSLRCVSLYWE